MHGQDTNTHLSEAAKPALIKGEGRLFMFFYNKKNNEMGGKYCFMFLNMRLPGAKGTFLVP
jgi:hypothetical protein